MLSTGASQDIDPPGPSPLPPANWTYDDGTRDVWIEPDYAQFTGDTQVILQATEVDPCRDEDLAPGEYYVRTVLHPETVAAVLDHLNELAAGHADDLAEARTHQERDAAARSYRDALAEYVGHLDDEGLLKEDTITVKHHTFWADDMSGGPLARRRPRRR